MVVVVVVVVVAVVVGVVVVVVAIVVVVVGASEIKNHINPLFSHGYQPSPINRIH